MKCEKTYEAIAGNATQPEAQHKRRVSGEPPFYFREACLRASRRPIHSRAATANRHFGRQATTTSRMRSVGDGSADEPADGDGAPQNSQNGTRRDNDDVRHRFDEDEFL